MRPLTLEATFTLFLAAMSPISLRQDQVRGVDHLVAEEEQVQVDRARLPFQPPHAAQLVLDVQESSKQRVRVERRFDGGGAVQEGG